MRFLFKASLVVMVAALCVIVGTSGYAGAISNEYFDRSNDTTPSPAGQTGYDSMSPWLTVGEAASTRRIETKVRIYFPQSSNNTGSVTIIGANYCPTSSIDDVYGTVISSPTRIAEGSRVTSFWLYNKNGQAINTTNFGVLRWGNSGCNSDNSTNNLTINLNGQMQWDSTVGMYVVTLHASHIDQRGANLCVNDGSSCDGIENYFKLRASSGGLISHSDGSTGYNTSMNFKGSSGGVYTSYNVRFGADCTLQGPERRYFYFYDLDNGAQGIQPQSLSVKLLKSVGGGSWTPVALMSTPGDWTRDPNDSYRYLPPRDNRSSIRDDISYMAEPDARYQLWITNAYSSNLIQFSVPFDGIYYNQPCNGTPSVTPSVSIDPSSTIGIADPVVGRLSFRNTGKSTVSKVNYRWEIIAFDGSSNRVAYRSTDTSTGTIASGSMVNVPTWGLLNWVNDILSVGTRGPNYVGISLDQMTYATRRICAQVSNISLEPSGNVGTGTRQACVDIAKAPALTVRGGDLRVGGSFAGVSGAACTIPRSLTSNNVPYGVLGYEYYGGSRSSLGEYATYTPGGISGYGSGGLPYDSGGNSWKYLLFGSQGFFDASQYAHSGLFLGWQNVGTGTTSYCLANLANMYYAGPSNTAIGTSAGITNSSPKANINYNFTGSNGTLNLSAAAGTQFNPGERAVIKVTQTQANNVGNKIIIRGPIRYATSGYTSIAQLPQFVLIADGKIDIQFDGSPGISKFEVNGLYSTKGNVYTCDGQSGEAGLTWSGQCSTPLVVNGAVIAAGRVLPFRTAGFDKKNDTNTYAEEFNLTPETLLGDYARGANSSNLSVDYVTEMPARY